MDYDICPHEEICKRANFGQGWVCQVPTAFYSLGQKCRVKPGKRSRSSSATIEAETHRQPRPVGGGNTERRVSLPTGKKDG